MDDKWMINDDKWMINDDKWMISMVETCANLTSQYRSAPIELLLLGIILQCSNNFHICIILLQVVYTMFTRWGPLVISWLIHPINYS